MKEVAAITGGSQGLGLACVERLVKDGYEVVFCGRNEETGQAVAKEFNATFIKVDVTDAAQVESFFNQIKEKFGRLDVLVNNAGMVRPAGKLSEIPLDVYHDTINVNQNGAWYTLKYGIALMESCGNGGRVVNMSSIGGFGGCTANNSAAYGAAKHAINGMTQIAALEYIPAKIRVNAVMPTAIATKMVNHFISTHPDPKAAKTAVAALNPMVGENDPLPDPSDVSGVVSFLCGPDSRFINGALIPVDGGYICK